MYHIFVQKYVYLPCTVEQTIFIFNLFYFIDPQAKSSSRRLPLLIICIGACLILYAVSRRKTQRTSIFDDAIARTLPKLKTKTSSAEERLIAWKNFNDCTDKCMPTCPWDDYECRRKCHEDCEDTHRPKDVPKTY